MLVVVLIILSRLALWFFRNTLLAFLGVVIAVGLSIPARWLQRLGQRPLDLYVHADVKF